MTRYISEDSDIKRVAAGEWDVRQLYRRPAPVAQGVAIHEIKVFEDVNQVIVGDDAFIWEIPEDLDGATIVKVAGFITTAGTGSTQVAIRLSDPCEVGTDILSAKIVIDSGECGSFEASTQPVVIPATTVTWGQHLHIDVDAAATGALGLGVHIIYTPADIASVILSGNQGAPGGVTQWSGAWTTATNYVAGDIVIHNGVTYVVTADHTSGATTEPGVGVDWEDFLAPLFETAVYSGLDVMMSGGGFALSVGIKAYISVPFDCEIIEATLLADQSGDCVVDIWKDTYGAHPPTDADSITGGNELVLSASNKTTDVVLSGWTTTLTAGDVLAVVLDSILTINVLTLALRLLRTP